MNATEFQAVLAQAVSAASKGQPMPQFGDLQITRVQMAVLNKQYDEARNAHHAKTRSRRR